MKCKYCERTYKNTHGLHIHQFYCLVKKFDEMPVKLVNRDKEAELMEDDRLIPSFRYLREWIKFAQIGEIGICLGKRYVLGSEASK